MDSAKIEWAADELAEGGFPFEDGLRLVRYLPVNVNAKNAYGAYTGQHSWVSGWDGTQLVGIFADGGRTWTTIG